MDDLITKLEAATEGSWKLDTEVQKVIDPHYRVTCSHNNPPKYTESIDSALTLVPDGVQGWSVETVIDSKFMCVLNFGHYDYTASATTPALALCAAILRALENDDG